VRPLQLISDLFFEESFVTFEEEKEAEYKILFAIKTDDKVSVEGTISESGNEKAFSASFENKFEEESEKERFKIVKRTVSYVYLMLLQHITEIEQPWGILTGIRPTKLLHNKLREGMTKEQAHEELRRDYLITNEKIQLMQRIVDRQLSIVPDLYELKKEVSIYIGIPFCPTKCAYCTFPAYAINGRQGSVDSFLGGLHYEMKWTCFMKKCTKRSQT
jgi:oxygen-independent coproporphyrinogen-3 oxidase